MIASPRAQTPVCFRCPDVAVPFGGVRLLFRHARILSAAGFQARVVSASKGLSRWLEEGLDLLVPESLDGAITVVPETDRVGVEGPGAKVFLAQSAAFASTFPDGFDLRSRGVLGALAVSRYVQEAFEDHFGMPARRIAPSVDGRLFKPSVKIRSIAFMPRRNRVGIEAILSRCRTEGFELVPIDGLPLAKVASELGRASIFLAASHPEGFGLPALEAMASGCLIVGYAGKGGLDYMEDGANCLLAEDGDADGAARQVRRAMDLVAAGEQDSLVAAARRTAERFSPEFETQEVGCFWRSILA